MVDGTLWAIGWVGFVVGQAVTPSLPEIGALTQTGALSVLAWVVWTQRQDVRDERTQRQEREVKDSEERKQLTEALVLLKAHCQGKIQGA